MTKNRRHDIVKPSKFKTSLCSFFLTAEGCPFGDKCAFAHGEAELRPEIAPEASESTDASCSADQGTRNVGAATPSSPDSEHVRGAAVSHKAFKSNSGKRGSHTGIILTNMARNVSTGAVNAGTAGNAEGGAAAATAVPTAPTAVMQGGVFFGGAAPQTAYAAYYAPPPGVSHVPFMTLNNNQLPVNSLAGSASMGFEGLGAPPYGMMPQMQMTHMTSRMESSLPPPPPPATHKPVHTGTSRGAVVGSNTITPAGLHRHGAMPLPLPHTSYSGSSFSPAASLGAHKAAVAPGMIMLPFTHHRGQAVPSMPMTPSIDNNGTPVSQPMHSAAQPHGGASVDNHHSSLSTTAAQVASSSALLQPTQQEVATSVWSESADNRLSFQSLMASAVPPTVVHIPLDAPTLGRVTPPSSVADAVGSWPSNAAANHYYKSQDSQAEEKNEFLSSLLEKVGGAGSGTKGAASRFGAIGATAVDAEDDNVDWSAVLESWARHQMQDEEETAEAATGTPPTTAVTSAVLPSVAADNGASAIALTPARTPAAPAVPSTVAVAKAAAATAGPNTHAVPVVATNMKPVMMALTKPVPLDATSTSAALSPMTAPTPAAVVTPTTSTPIVGGPAPAKTSATVDGSGKRKSLLCSVIRGAHTAGVSDADSAPTRVSSAARAEPDEQSVLLYNPQRNTVYYITRNSKTRLTERRETAHSDPAASIDTVAARGNAAPLCTSHGDEKDEHGKNSSLSHAGSHDSSLSEPGQSGHDSNTRKTELLAPQSFRCRPGKRKFLVLGEADSDDEAEYCI